MKKISITGAKEHNLCNVSLDIPRDSLVVFTGVSGSGKSSLAFDTIFSEGQRRYVESLSSYARQYIGQLEKPDVESIEGLSPAIAIDQKTASQSPRSTVGTVTEIYDYLRLLYAKIGVAHSLETGEALTAYSLDRITDEVAAWKTGSKLQILSPVVRGRKGDYNALFAQLLKEGFVRARIDGEEVILDELPDDHRLERNKLHDIDVVVDRIVLKQDDKTYQRLSTAIEKALKKSDGYVMVQNLSNNPPSDTNYATKMGTAGKVSGEMQEMSPRLFSFNSPYGACSDCDGLGVTYALSEELLVPDATKSLSQGAIAPFQKFTGRYYNSFLRRLAKEYKLSIEKPFKSLSKREKDLLMYGEKNADKTMNDDLSGTMDDDDDDWFQSIQEFDGVLNILKRRYLYGSEATKRYINNFMKESTCTACEGKRLQPFSLSVTLTSNKTNKDEKNIADLCALSINDAQRWVSRVGETLSPIHMEIARQPLIEIEQRLQFLVDVGLEYLTLNRSAKSLSGGEAQRIRLASQIGSGLSGVLYILDEPSIGLHQHNNLQLIQTLCKLRDKGNSLIVVEHDEETIRTADWVIDIGPGAGIQGGQILVEGHKKDLEACALSITGQYLSGKKKIEVPKKRRKGNGEKLTIHNASLHNLKNVTVDFPLGTLTTVTGLSGSGKSTLVFDILQKALHYHFGRYHVKPQGYDDITGLEHLDKVIAIDQSPIGRSPRSNPATYTGLFDLIRQMYARSEEAQIRGFNPGRFSFNTKGGRCEACRGVGYIVREMQFLANVNVPCDICHGRRYNEDTMSVLINEKSIADVLEMSVAEALTFFEHSSKIKNHLQTLMDVGLDYITLGQPATTLSGGEAQRIKLATEFNKKSTGQTLYVLDEPSIGLHWHDLEKLILILNRLVDQGNTVLVIEHNLDVIKVSDHLIEMGPESGEKGGELVTAGTPEAIAKHASSYTGQYLKDYL